VARARGRPVKYFKILDDASETYRLHFGRVCGVTGRQKRRRKHVKCGRSCNLAGAEKCQQAPGNSARPWNQVDQVLVVGKGRTRVTHANTNGLANRTRSGAVIYDVARVCVVLADEIAIVAVTDNANLRYSEKHIVRLHSLHSHVGHPMHS